MVRKGLIFRVRDNDQVLYQAYQFMIGIYEFQVKNLDSEFSQMFEEYLPYLGISLARVKTKQLRVIPVESAVTTLHNVAPYNKIRETGPAAGLDFGGRLHLSERTEAVRERMRSSEGDLSGFRTIRSLLYRQPMGEANFRRRGSEHSGSGGGVRSGAFTLQYTGIGGYLLLLSLLLPHPESREVGLQGQVCDGFLLSS